MDGPWQKITLEALVLHTLWFAVRLLIRDVWCAPCVNRFIHVPLFFAYSFLSFFSLSLSLSLSLSFLQISFSWTLRALHFRLCQATRSDQLSNEAWNHNSLACPVYEWWHFCVYRHPFFVLGQRFFCGFLCNEGAKSLVSTCVLNANIQAPTGAVW